MKNGVKNLVKSVIPHRYHFYLQRRKTAEKYASDRKENVRFNVTDQVYLDVYWKILNLGKGPALILNVMGEEVLRFDFFGQGAGHYHVTVPEIEPNSKSLLFFAEQTIPEQIDRALFELNKNIDWYLHRHPLRQIRQIKIDKSRMRQATEAAKAQLLAYIGEAEKLEERQKLEDARTSEPLVNQ